MGEWNCYCALCSTPLGGFILFGSKKPKHLAKRRKRVAKKQAGENPSDVDGESEGEGEGEDVDGDVEMEDAESDQRSGAEQEEEDPSSDEDFDPEQSEASSDWDSEDDSAEFSDFNEDGEISDVDVERDPSEVEESDVASIWSSEGEVEPKIWGPHQSKEDQDMFDYYEHHSYDPFVLSGEDVKWLSRGRCLAFNSEAPGISKVFISGRGTCDSFGYFKSENRSFDPNADEDAEEWPCYNSYDADKQISFPFHETCYKIFARNLFGEPDFRRIDKDALYSAMEQAIGRPRSLDLYYGDFDGPEQFWECYQGEEYLVFDPARSLRLSENLREMLPAQLFTPSATMPDLAHQVKNDPFGKLPYDVLYMIFPRLSNNDIFSLTKASWFVNSITRSNDVWKRLLNTRIFPWFWEAKDFFEETALLGDFDYKRTFLGLNMISTPKIGLQGPWMGIANRRRIWNACNQLKEIYRNFSPMDDNTKSTDDEEAQDIMTSAISLQMPMVAYPKPNRVSKTVSTQWIKSWSDVYSRSCAFETYWHNSEDEAKVTPEASSLRGIGVKFGSDERGFNYPKGDREVWGSRTVVIDENDWIKELVVHIRNIDMLTIAEDRSHISSSSEILQYESAFIMGVTIVLKSGIRHDLYGGEKPWAGLNQRAFIASEGHSIVGIAGQIGENNIIATLDILQCIHNGWEPPEPPYLTPSEHLLWASQATKLPYPSIPSTATIPIWNHPTLSMSRFSEISHRYSIPLQMLPYQALLWAPTPSAYHDLTAISAFCVNVCVGEYDHYGSELKCKAVIPDIIGLRAEYVDEGETKYREIGSGGPVPFMTDPKWREGLQQSDEGDFSLNPTPNPEPWCAFNTQRFEIDGQRGEVVTSVHVAEDAKAIKLRTNRGRECYWGEVEQGSWSEMETESGEGRVIVGLAVCFGELGGWSWKYKGNSHWKTASVSVLSMPSEEVGSGSGHDV
ncbi:hypothetical protein CC80DRAFT_592526 [Byssothecium circinans]|uniref:F-box domain-containing protein n=1 Tax=Byssothecium circinans TaxID=147558 RepID=A0A6A5U088_9PLEO|nr:hypothetical protein CC80DRAFT_592526 [Byssothecium circinans]